MRDFPAPLAISLTRKRPQESWIMIRMLEGKVALVAGATRGAGRGIAVELGAAGATVYVTGRTTRAQRSEYNRPETIEETAELVQHAGG
jgi:NAD(P)-dependent dehydrogenase (short-subunit alcohol dehydrogenase family)